MCLGSDRKTCTTLPELLKIREGRSIITARNLHLAQCVECHAFAQAVSGQPLVQHIAGRLKSIPTIDSPGPQPGGNHAVEGPGLAGIEIGAGIPVLPVAQMRDAKRYPGK